MTMTLSVVMVVQSFVPVWCGGRLGEAAVGEDDLAVDPAGGAGEEGDGLGDVLGLAEALEGGGLGQVRDGRVVLSVEEQCGGGGAGGDGVDGDVLAAQFAGQDQRHALHRGLAGGVRAGSRGGGGGGDGRGKRRN